MSTNIPNPGLGLQEFCPLFKMNIAPLRTVLLTWELHMPLGLICLSLIEIGIKWPEELGGQVDLGPGTHPQFFALIEAKPSSLSDLARRHVQTPLQ